MPNFCCAYGCSNHSSKPECKNITFHRFPLNQKSLLKKWLISIKRTNFRPTAHHRICSIHFEDTCFEIENFTHRRRIKHDAIPSKFIFTKPNRKERPLPHRIRNSEVHEIEHSNMEDNNIEEESSNEKSTQTDDDSRLNMCENIINVENKLKPIEKFKLSPDSLNKKQMLSFTGLNKIQFDCIYDFLSLKSLTNYCNLYPPKQLFFIVLVRLKTDLPEEALGAIFELSQATISKFLILLIDVIYARMKTVNIWPSKEKVKRHMAVAFRKSYPECRVVVDSTELYIFRNHPVHSSNS